jgi:hypothetical protein
MRNLVIVMAALCGCANQQYLWYKYGSTRQTFGQDQYACLQESQQRVQSAYVGPYGGSASDNVRTNVGLFNACMTARGWELRPAQ